MRTILFEDTFNYEGAPDPSKWTHEIGNNNGNNDEEQWYSKSLNNSHVSNGTLKIVSLNEEINGFHYSSARINTYGKFSYTYGRLDVRAKLPTGKGSWPAIWLLPDSLRKGETAWPRSGEIDVMEHVGKNENNVHVSLHSENFNHMHQNQPTWDGQIKNVGNEWHIYSVERTEDFISFLIDDVEVYRFNKSDTDGSDDSYPFNKPFYIILNTACGGFWEGTIDKTALPYTFEIDYVRVYE